MAEDDAKRMAIDIVERWAEVYADINEPNPWPRLQNGIANALRSYAFVRVAEAIEWAAKIAESEAAIQRAVRQMAINDSPPLSLSRVAWRAQNEAALANKIADAIRAHQKEPVHA